MERGLRAAPAGKGAGAPATAELPPRPRPDLDDPLLAQFWRGARGGSLRAAAPAPAAGYTIGRPLRTQRRRRVHVGRRPARGHRPQLRRRAPGVPRRLRGTGALRDSRRGRHTRRAPAREPVGRRSRRGGDRRECPRRLRRRWWKRHARLLATRGRASAGLIPPKRAGVYRFSAGIVGCRPRLVSERLACERGSSGSRRAMAGVWS